ncbi:thioredoxin-like protein HCF164, chloroplastic [Nicotiana tabacum]|uniref:Thioredoxin-like protein HCF164, chloroplastic n=1 Tax=Nicotiana tabacum TaxID=4097 RepID=A0A1S3X5X6_TOBAC|nr:thioredoxin-like protein HCF164, chloroplastic [Nicotiana tomentosiformis]XP_016435246.1 PREDICTED: thioredoxin-like protein HCF164, chloroplastic [Nicotiana tabacum]
MARVISSPIGLHKLRPFHFRPHQSLHFVKPSIYQLKNVGKYQRIYCQTDPKTGDCCQENSNPPESAVKDKSSGVDTEISKAEVSAPSSGPEYPTKDFNRRVALVSVLAALGLFSSQRVDFGIPSLKDITAAALPYEEALSNGKPTVVEFYADWCEVCRELAPDVYKIEQQYKDRVNFVMLNVDNTKWEQELDEFGVEGIPHFAFLDKNGNEEGNVVGRLPRQYLLENVDALARGKESIPYSRAVGQYTSAESRKVHQVSDPRNHG